MYNTFVYNNNVKQFNKGPQGQPNCNQDIYKLVLAKKRVEFPLDYRVFP